MARMASHHHCGLSSHSAARIGIARIPSFCHVVPSTHRVCGYGIAYPGLRSRSRFLGQCYCSDGQGGRNGRWSPYINSLLSFLPVERKAIWCYVFGCWMHRWHSCYTWYVLFLGKSFERSTRGTRNRAGAYSLWEVDLLAKVHRRDVNRYSAQRRFQQTQFTSHLASWLTSIQKHTNLLSPDFQSKLALRRN
jgi:hypothetical protein